VGGRDFAVGSGGTGLSSRLPTGLLRGCSAPIILLRLGALICLAGTCRRWSAAHDYPAPRASRNLVNSTRQRSKSRWNRVHSERMDTQDERVR
jgi:hypothetical protein